MANKNKAAGTEFESRTVARVRDAGGKAERIALAGADEGDVYIEIRDRSGTERRIVVECKATRSIDLAGFVQQALVERDNYCRRRGLDPADYEAVVFIKRRNHPWESAYAVTTVAEYLRMEGK